MSGVEEVVFVSKVSVRLPMTKSSRQPEAEQQSDPVHPAKSLCQKTLPLPLLRNFHYAEETDRRRR